MQFHFTGQTCFFVRRCRGHGDCDAWRDESTNAVIKHLPRPRPPNKTKTIMKQVLPGALARYKLFGLGGVLDRCLRTRNLATFGGEGRPLFSYFVAGPGRAGRRTPGAGNPTSGRSPSSIVSFRFLYLGPCENI